jgi:hypothetical protein
MSPLRRRMIEDMQIRNLSPHTQRAYVDQVVRGQSALKIAPPIGVQNCPPPFMVACTGGSTGRPPARRGVPAKRLTQRCAGHSPALFLSGSLDRVQ